MGIRRTPQHPGAALLLLALAGVGCFFVTPFALGDAVDAAPDADADTDADGDADAVGDADVDHDWDAEVDGDVDPWDPAMTCTGGPTEEQWIVVASIGDTVRSFLTESDCANPVELCEGCVVTAISPDGSRALALRYTSDPARVFDDIGLVELPDPDTEVESLAVEGAQPTWINDDEVLYMAAHESWEGACVESPALLAPERTELVRLTVSTGDERVIGEPLRRTWSDASHIVTLDERHLIAVGNHTSDCDDWNHGVTIVDLASGASHGLEWSRATVGDDPDFTFGLLPGGNGFLVQTIKDTRSGLSAVIAATVDGLATRVSPPMGGDEATFEADFDGYVVARAAEARWGHCATVRRLGPACEFYCRVPGTQLWQRRTVHGDPPEDIPACSTLGDEVRIMDVRQVAAR